MAIKPPSMILMGAPGAGKTYSLATFLPEVELFVLITDPGGEESLLDACADRGLSLDKVHWRYISPISGSWQGMKEMANKISAMGYEDLSKIKSGISKRSYQQYYQVLLTCENFVCDHCGKEFGDVTTWDASRAFAIDSLSGINTLALNMVIGAKPVPHRGEWGVAMSAEEGLIYKLTADLSCFFVLIAHVEREVNEIEGRTQLMVGALGRKLSPKMPRTFSDVVLAVNEGGKFFWSTATIGADLKNRSLPTASKLPPDFGQIVRAYKERVNSANQGDSK